MPGQGNRTVRRSQSKSTSEGEQIIARVFERHYRPGAEEITFERNEVTGAAQELGLARPRNVKGLIRRFRYQTRLPAAIRDRAPAGRKWTVRPAGFGRYRFAVVAPSAFAPNPFLVETEVRDATPGLIAMYALSDEQALLARLRYNRLLDIFTGVTCYPLQSHLRTTVADIGQVELDEVYVGVDRRGVHYVIPVEAKSARESLGSVQVEQSLAVCGARFPTLVCRPIGAQFMQDDLIALFEFEDTDQGIRIVGEKHYRLVPWESLSPEELASYRNRPE